LRQSGQHLDDAVMSRYLRDALQKLELHKEGRGWYQATRHTFASQFVIRVEVWKPFAESLGTRPCWSPNAMLTCSLTTSPRRT
jgi:hypothetical protein